MLGRLWHGLTALCVAVALVIQLSITFGVSASPLGHAVGTLAGAELVGRLVGFFRARGTEDVSEFEVLREDVRFMLPKVIRQATAARDA